MIIFSQVTIFFFGKKEGMGEASSIIPFSHYYKGPISSENIRLKPKDHLFYYTG